MPKKAELKTYWNYRVVRRTEQGETWLALHEAYYQDGAVMGITQDPVNVHGNDLEDLKAGYKLMKLAFNKPVLDYSTLKELSDDEISSAHVESGAGDRPTTQD